MRMIELQRRVRNFNQEQMGRELLYSVITLRALEHGKIPPHRLAPRLRRAIEDYFGLPAETLLAEVRPSDLPAPKGVAPK